MSIIIQNISTDTTPEIGTNRYRVMLNKRTICEFDHERAHNGLAKCLRDAADAVENSRKDFFHLGTNI